MKKIKLLRWAFRAGVVAVLAGAPVAIFVAISAIPGCPRMREQARLKPYEQNDFFDDKSTLRHPPRGTVARGPEVLDAHFYYGRKTLPEVTMQSAPAGTSAEERPTAQEPKAPPAQMQGAPSVEQNYVDSFPFAITKEAIERGREHYQVYCTPCHGAAGYGNGVATHSGFPKPPSYHTDRLRQAPLGYFFDVISNGFGRMYSYGSRLTPRERWETIAYIRALQYSQYAPARQLDPEDRRRLEEASP